MTSDDVDEVRAMLQATARSAFEYIRRAVNTKYKAVAFNEREFWTLVNEGDYEVVVNDDLPDNKYAKIESRRGEDTLIFDHTNLPGPVLDDFTRRIKRIHKSQNGFELEHRFGIKDAVNDPSVDQVYNRWKNRIPPKYLPVLEQALILRVTERQQDIDQNTVYEWRGEVADGYGDRGHDPADAQTLISMCSTGYFDENDVFDMMYTDMVENGSTSIDEFQSLFDKYVSESPFAVFVRSDGRSTEDICKELSEKLSIINEWDGTPGFVEVCGKGEDAHETVRQVQQRAGDGFEGDVQISINQDIDQLIIRFSPPLSTYET